MYKNKELKIIEQNELHALGWHAISLSIILAEENFIPWFYENFINISCMKYNDFNIEFEYYGNGIYKGKEYDILETINLDQHSNIKGNTLIQFIRKNIDDNFYINVNLDEYYLKDSSSYQEYHFVHDSLLYGYDDEKQQIYSLILSANRRFEKVIYSYDEACSAFSAVDHIKGEYHLSLQRIKRNFRPYPFNLSQFINQLGNYISSTAEEIQTYHIEHSAFETDKMSYGTNVYLTIISVLENMLLESEYVYLTPVFNTLWEHKQILLKRFEYVNKKYELNEKFDRLITEYKSVEYDFNIIFSLAAKFDALFSENKLLNSKQVLELNKIILGVKKVKMFEENVLFEIYNILDSYSKMNYPKTLQPNISGKYFFEYNENEIFLKSNQAEAINRIRIINCSPITVLHHISTIELSNGQKYYTTGEIQNNIVADISFDPQIIDEIKIVSQDNIHDIKVELLQASFASKGQYFASTINFKNPSGILCKPGNAFKNVGSWIAIAENDIEVIGVDFTDIIQVNTVIIKQNKWINNIYNFSIEFVDENNEWTSVYRQEDKSKFGVL